MKKFKISLGFFILLTISLTGCGAHSHTLHERIIKEATHLEEGIKEIFCDSCDYKVQTSIDKLSEHTFDQKVVAEKYKASDATETKKARYYYSCLCGEHGDETFEWGDVLVDKYIIYNGDATINDDSIISNDSKTILLLENKTFTKGTISINLTPKVKGDSGLIFNVSRGKLTTFFEEGTSYYFYFINKDGMIYLGKVNNGSWEELYSTKIDDFSVDNSYKLEVSLDTTINDHTKINCFLDDKFIYSESDLFKINDGFEYGIRFGTPFTTSSKITKDSHFKEEEKRTCGDFILANGELNYDCDNDEYFVNKDVAIGFVEDEFDNGSISTKVRQSGIESASCNGLIFGLDNYDRSTFFEKGILYYYFFIDERGYTRLSKVSMGSWTDLAQGIYVPGFSYSGENTLKVVKDGVVIKCYIDRIEEPVITYTEGVPLLGKYYGVRLGSNGARLRDMKVVKNGSSSYKEPENYELISGSYLTADNNSFISSSVNNIALRKDKYFTSGTLSVDLITNSTNKTGVIFRANNDCSSYYKFVIWGNNCQLFKVVNNNQIELSPQQFITASHNNGSKETILVSIDDVSGTIRCYVRGILYAIKSDELLAGSRYGIIAEAKSSVFEEAITSTSIKHDTAKTLVFGHSYMELWDNWQSDLNMFEDVKNIGIGGSVASQWNNLEDEIVDYSPETGIFMIGINDLTGYAFTPSQVYENVKLLLSNLKVKIPSLKRLVLLSCNRSPNREDIVPEIRQLNEKFHELVNEPGFEWVKYGDLDNAFLDSNGNPIPSKFKDGLHPAANSYVEIVDAILKAININ